MSMIILRATGTLLYSFGKFPLSYYLKLQVSERQIGLGLQFFSDSEPVCGTNASNSSFLEGDFIHMWCKVNYSGNYILVMEWTRNDGQTVDTYTRSSRRSSKVTSSLIKKLISRDNNVTFTCKTSLNLNSTNGIPAGVDITKATNIIYYQYSWNYTAIVYRKSSNIHLFIMHLGVKSYD